MTLNGQPEIIIVSSLLSTTAVFTALWLTGVELSITVLMGMTMIIVIGTEMAMFYVSEYDELSHQMPPREALVQASRDRLRPATITTLAAILTLFRSRWPSVRVLAFNSPWPLLPSWGSCCDTRWCCWW